MSQAPLNAVVPLPEQTYAKEGYTHSLDISYLDFALNTTVSTAVTILVAATALGDQVGPVGYQLITPFQDSGDPNFNTFGVTAGNTAGVSNLMVSKETNANGSYISAWASNLIVAPVGADTFNLVFTPTSGKAPSTLDTGLFRFFFKLPKLPIT